MNSLLSSAQLTGKDETHLVTLPDGHRLHPEAAAAFLLLQEDAREAGFDLAIASSFRSYDRQLAIFNGKACCQRAVHDDEGRPVAMSALAPEARLAAILRFSALPGTSRHHWGTDLDVYDAAAIARNYQVQLSPEEVAAGGVFDPLHCWLDQRMAGGQSHGFFRPYGEDVGGVAVERWHLSYAPISLALQGAVDAEILAQCWGNDLELGKEVNANLGAILSRYVQVPDDWCPTS